MESDNEIDGSEEMEIMENPSANQAGQRRQTKSLKSSYKATQCGALIDVIDI